MSLYVEEKATVHMVYFKTHGIFELADITELNSNMFSMSLLPAYVNSNKLLGTA